MTGGPARHRWLSFAAAVALLGGCASDPFLAADARRYTVPVELAETPFFPQDEYQCGPAALATVLQSTGLDVTPEELIPKVYLPARRGSLQPEMLAASRDYGRLPFVIAPEFAALLAEVAAGRPVLVLQNLGIKAVPLWHYAVVIGFSPDEGDVILRSGKDRRRVTPADVFVRTWQRSENWGMITLLPGELPASNDADRYLSAVAAVETTGHLEQATAGYRTALGRWPDSSLAHLGLGNTAWRDGRADDAEQWYRRALALDPADVVTLNNLASVIAAEGRCSEAAAMLQRAVARLPDDSPLADALAGTRREIDDCMLRPR